MIPRLPMLLCWLLACEASLAQPAKQRLDANGLPLPDGAVARIGDPRFVASRDYVNTVAWSPDGKLVAGGGLRIALWDANSSRIVRRMPGYHQPYVKALAWSRNGRLLASMTNDSSFTIWNAETAKPHWTDT